MIIGNGMLAKEFSHYKYDKEMIIFASGVSNSKETKQAEFHREKELLLDVMQGVKNERLIYFSTCSMYDNYFEPNAYTQHKLSMESILLNSELMNFTVFRLPQVLGKNNQFQLMGFLYEKIQHGQLFDLYDIERNLIDIEDVRKTVDYIVAYHLFNKKVVNIANSCNIRVVDLVKKVENLCGKKARYNLVKKCGSFDIDVNDVSFIFQHLELFSSHYIEDKVYKYYG